MLPRPGSSLPAGIPVPAQAACPVSVGPGSWIGARVGDYETFDEITGEELSKQKPPSGGVRGGQFYTPAEVGRITAVIRVSPAASKAAPAACAPTCGLGSLLPKVAARYCKHVTLEGEEMHATTASRVLMKTIGSCLFGR